MIVNDEPASERDDDIRATIWKARSCSGVKGWVGCWDISISALCLAPKVGQNVSIGVDLQLSRQCAEVGSSALYAAPEARSR